MNVYECLRTRRTVREFKPDPVSNESLAKLLSAARWSPSSRNQQPWRLVVVRDRDTLAKLGETASTGGFLARAPLAIAIVMENADQPQMDAGRALQQMELIAWSEGMGTCFVTLTDDQRESIASLLGIPQGLELITVLPFGYRRDDFRGRGVARKRMSELVHAERYGDPSQG